MKLVIRPAARRDILRQIRYYLEEDAGEAAIRFRNAVNDSILSLTRNPFLGAPKRTNTRTLAGLRSWPVRDFEDFRVYYIAETEALRVIRVLHDKRDLDTFFSGPGQQESD